MANYLYNGVELPALPEWDRETYPYATIGYDDNNRVILELHTSLLYFSKTYSGIGYGNGGVSPYENCVNRWYSLSADGTEWVHGGDYDIDVTDQSTDHMFVSAIWSNADIANRDDNSVYLSATDPIPVNPAPSLDPTALLMGWQVGNKIARQRGKA